MDYQTTLELDDHDGVLTMTERSDHADSTFDTSLITDALSRLNPEHRMVIVRAYYCGESITELADALDVPQGTVKSRLHYGWRALRLALQENGVTRRRPPHADPLRE